VNTTYIILSVFLIITVLGLIIIGSLFYFTSRISKSFKEQENDYKNLSKESLEKVIEPFRDRIKEFEDEIKRNSEQQLKLHVETKTTIDGLIEKTNQIGILLAQGIPRSVLKKVFIIQGGFIGLLGGLIGGIISIVLITIQLKYRVLDIPSDIYFMDQIPFSFNYTIFSSILLLSIFLSIIISWIPINRISTFKPSKALRYE